MVTISLFITRQDNPSCEGNPWRVIGPLKDHSAADKWLRDLEFQDFECLTRIKHTKHGFTVCATINTGILLPNSDEAVELLE